MGELAFLSETCPLCGGQGMRVLVGENGNRYAERCSRKQQQRGSQTLSRARIPVRYEHCDLESYAFGYSGANPSLRRAYMLVERYLNEYPLGTNGTGLLFTGPSASARRTSPSRCCAN